jgi:hypothetical protein
MGAAGLIEARGSEVTQPTSRVFSGDELFISTGAGGESKDFRCWGFTG